MKLSFFTNKELTEALEKLKALALSGERVVSWTSSGTSVTKRFFGEDPQKMVSHIAREIAHRKASGTFPTDELPEIVPAKYKKVFPGLIAVQ